MQNERARRIEVLIVSANHMVRTGIRMILQAHQNMHVAGEGSASHSAPDLTTSTHPDVILLDLDLPGLQIERFLLDVRAAAEHSSVLLLADLEDEEVIGQALHFGAAGVILKVQPPTVLVAAINSLSDDVRIAGVAADRRPSRPKPSARSPRPPIKRRPKPRL